MRHFRSILYALVLAPAVWVLVAVGLTHDLTARGRDGFAVESLTGLVLLLLGGAAYGILVFAPISPLGPVVAGVVFLGVGVWAIESPAGYAGVWPAGVVKEGFDLSRPGYGLAALLSVPLILTVLSVRRWSGFEPVVLPIIGPVGRARGSAAAPGTPMAVMQTAVLRAPAVSQSLDSLLGGSRSDASWSAGSRSGAPGSAASRAVDDGERTTLLRMPGADAAPDVTTVLPLLGDRAEPDDGEDTTVLQVPAEATALFAAVGDERATEDVAAGNEELTEAIAAEKPTGDVRDEPDTEDVPTGSEEPTDAIADEEPTRDVHDQHAPENGTVSSDEPTHAIADELPTQDVHGEPTPEEGTVGGVKVYPRYCLSCGYTMFVKAELLG